MPATTTDDAHNFGDLIARVAKLAIERGQRLVITTDPTGQPLYRLVDVPKTPRSTAPTPRSTAPTSSVSRALIGKTL